MVEGYFIPAMILVATAFAGGAAMLLIGLRGRRVTDHPTCRRCRYDLHGLAEGTTACPECGADLKRRRAVRKGLRVRRRGVLITGLALLLFALMPTGFYARELYRNPELRPTWMLMMQLKVERGNWAEEAVGVLGIRTFKGELTRDQSRTIFEVACQHLTPAQVNQKPSYSYSGRWTEWDHYVYTAITRNYVSDKRTTRLIQDTGRLELRSELSLDGTVNLRLVSMWPDAVYQAVDHYYDISSVSLRVDGQELDEQQESQAKPTFGFADAVTLTLPPSAEARVVTIDLEIESKYADAPITDWNWTEHLRCDVPPHDGTHVEIQWIDDSVLELVIRDAIDVYIQDVSSLPDIRKFAVDVALGPIERQGLGFAFELYVDGASGFHLIGSLNSKTESVFNPHPQHCTGDFTIGLHGSKPKTVSLRLVPSNTIANRHRLKKIYGKEIVIENVPVQ